MIELGNTYLEKVKERDKQAIKKRKAVLKQVCKSCGLLGSITCQKCHIEKTRNE